MRLQQPIRQQSLRCSKISKMEKTDLLTDSIEDIQKAKEPLYTSKPNLERSGMGFSLMECFMDELIVQSQLGYGTTITMKKILDN